MKFSLKSIAAAIAVAVTMTACNFGTNDDTSSATVTYESTDLLMHVTTPDGNSTMPTAPKVQALFSTKGDKSTMTFQFTGLTVATISSTFTTPELPVTFTESGMKVNATYITANGLASVINSLSCDIVGNWMYLKLEINGEEIDICSAWIWNGAVLYEAGYIINEYNKGLVVLGGKTSITIPAISQTTETEAPEYGIYFDTVNKKANVYSFFTTLTGSDTDGGKTYLIEGIPYTMDGGGISLQLDETVTAKVVTKTTATEDPDMTISAFSAYIPYSSLNSRLSFVATDNNISVRANNLEILNALEQH